MKSCHHLGIWLLAFALLNSGCQGNNSTPTAINVSTVPPTSALATANASTITPLPNATPSEFPELPTPTPPGIQALSKVLTLSYCPQASDATCDIWLLQPPYQTMQPLWLHDTDYAYCCPQWSPDGQKIAYVRIHITAPLSASLWISRLDGSNVQQIGDETRGGLLPIGWTTDGQAGVFFKGDNLYQTDIQSGKESLIDPLPHLASLGIEAISTYSQLIRFYTGTNQLLLQGHKDDRRVFFVANLESLDVFRNRLHCERWD